MKLADCTHPDLTRVLRSHIAESVEYVKGYGVRLLTSKCSTEPGRTHITGYQVPYDGGIMEFGLDGIAVRDTIVYTI